MKMEEVIGELVVRKKSFDISCNNFHAFYYISSCIFLLTAAFTSKDRIHFIVLTGFGLTLSFSLTSTSIPCGLLQQLIKVVIKWSTSWELYINGFLVLLRVLLIVGYHVIIEPFKKKKKKKTGSGFCHKRLIDVREGLFMV